MSFKRNSVFGWLIIALIGLGMIAFGTYMNTYWIRNLERRVQTVEEHQK